jgi:hypothetical protein
MAGSVAAKSPEGNAPRVVVAVFQRPRQAVWQARQIPEISKLGWRGVKPM